MRNAFFACACVILTILVWAGFDIWIHDYGIVPYYEKFGMITQARNAYLYGFWTFAILHVLVISIILKAWRYFVSLLILMASGAEDAMYYMLLPWLNPGRAKKIGEFMPDTLAWLNDNVWLKWLSGGEVVTERGVYTALAIGVFAVMLVFTVGMIKKKNET